MAVSLAACSTEARGVALPATVEPAHSPRDLPGDLQEIWPSSGEAREALDYRYETSHCGLSYAVDFDGSFWRVDGTSGVEEGDLENFDEGILRLVSEDEAEYESSSGWTARLERIEGPASLGGCG